MIVGIGCDLCAVERIEKIFAKPSGRHFVKRVYAPAEIAVLGFFEQTTEDAFATEELEYLKKVEEVEQPVHLKKQIAESAAANYAAKEAFLKAISKGLSGFPLCEIAALRTANGAPYYAFSGAAAEYMFENGYRAHLSLTHESGMAMAYCIIENIGLK